MLDKLPAEIFELIAKEIGYKRDLKHLCQASKPLYSLTIPYLYETIVIEAEDESLLEEPEIDLLLRAARSSTTPFLHVKTVQVLSRFHRKLRYRCVHDQRDIWDWGTEEDEEEGEERSKFKQLATNLLPLLQRLKDNRLRSFQWTLGTCIPPLILGDCGYLAQKQTSIESLSLVTAGDCTVNTEDVNPIDLSAFRSLRNITWINPYSKSDVEALSIALLSNSEHLLSLQLDFVSLAEFDRFFGIPIEEGRPRNFFVREVLKLPFGQVGVQFSALRVLSLNSFSFESAETEMLWAFNVGNLRSLTLRICPGMGDFLKALMESDQTLKLESLELQGKIGNGFDISNDFLMFIGSFQGLKDIYIAHPGPAPTLSYWQTFRHHISTLNRLVVHQRYLNTDDESSRYGEEPDLNDFSLLEVNIAELMDPALKHPFAGVNLECIGLGATAYYLKPLLAPFTANHTLKLLHMRRSGSDLAGLTSFEKLMNWEDSGHPEHNSSGSTMSLSNTLDNIHDKQRDNEENEGEDADEDEEEDDITSRTSLSSEADYEYRSLHKVSMFLMDLLDFAQWAFGPEGYPELKVLAYGDFSYQGRFSGHNMLLCRETKTSNDASSLKTRSKNYREVTKKDTELWDLLDRNADFLEACPTEPIVKV